MYHERFTNKKINVIETYNKISNSNIYTIDKILRINYLVLKPLSEFTNVDMNLYLNNSRKIPYIDHKFIAIIALYNCFPIGLRREYQLTYKNIGKIFCNIINETDDSVTIKIKDHATVVNALKKGSIYMNQHPNLYKHLLEAYKQINFKSILFNES
jgi:hypothetical protein